MHVFARYEAIPNRQIKLCKSATYRAVKKYLYCDMVFERGGCIYIMTNKTHSVLYVGVTSDLIGRIWQHKNKVHPKSFTAKCNCTYLVYYCSYSTIMRLLLPKKLLKAVADKPRLTSLTL